MDRPRCTPLIINTNEWQRLKKQAIPHEKTAKIEKESNYLNKLIDQSQAWIKTWPDTVEGHVTEIEKQRKKKYDEDKALINSIAKSIEKESTNEAVKKARQLIFDDSCYGRQLISALLESKTIEERDIQIQFKSKMKEDNTDNTQSTSSSFILLVIQENEAEIKRRNVENALDCARSNKIMNKIKKENITKEKVLEKNAALEDKYYVEELLKREEQKKQEIKRSQIETAKKYEEERIKIKELHEKQRNQDNMLTDFYHNRQLRLQYKINRVLKEIRKDRQEMPISKKVFKEFQKCYEDENDRYQFVDEVIKKQEKRESLFVKNEIENLQRKFEKQCSIAVYNKSVAEKEFSMKYNTENKSTCDRQTLSFVTVQSKTKKKERNTKPQINSDPISLLEELKVRENIPSPWNGTKAMHEQFAREASEIMNECRHKNPIKKVIDGYRRLNNLDQSSLPIYEY